MPASPSDKPHMECECRNYAGDFTLLLQTALEFTSPARDAQLRRRIRELAGELHEGYDMTLEECYEKLSDWVFGVRDPERFESDPTYRQNLGLGPK